MINAQIRCSIINHNVQTSTHSKHATVLIVIGSIRDAATRIAVKLQKKLLVILAMQGLLIAGRVLVTGYANPK